MFSTLDNRTENYSTQVNTPGNTSGKVCNMIPSINLVNLELIQPDPKNQSTQDCGGGGRPLHSELDSNVLNMNDKRKYHRHHIILIPFIHLSSLYSRSNHAKRSIKPTGWLRRKLFQALQATWLTQEEAR